MNILVTVAHPNELKIIKENIKNLKLVWVKIYYIQTWIGNYETIYNLTKVIESNKIDFLLNIWVCWYKEENNWVIQVARIVNFWTNKELLVPIIFEFAKLESICCSEKIITSTDELSWEKYVDMESYWIEFLANKYQIPRLILKIPADNIWEKFDINILKESCEKLWTEIDYIKLFEKIISYINSIPIEDSHDYLREKYYFTFQEFEIIKWKISKFEALTCQSFKEFFEEYWNLDKNEFMKTFDNIKI